jgi:hypothetical protein
MGRGREWTPEELIHVAEAYVATTMNPIVATDQTPYNFAGEPPQDVRDRMPDQVPGPREATGKKQAHSWRWMS